MVQAILCRPVSTAARNMDLLGVWWYYPDITAGVGKKGNPVGRENFEKGTSIIYNALSYKSYTQVL